MDRSMRHGRRDPHVQTKRAYRISVEHYGIVKLGRRGRPNRLGIYGHVICVRVSGQNRRGREGMYPNESDSAIDGLGRVAAE